jgi:hypothetical protein
MIFDAEELLRVYHSQIGFCSYVNIAESEKCTSSSNGAMVAARIYIITCLSVAVRKRSSRLQKCIDLEKPHRNDGDTIKFSICFIEYPYHKNVFGKRTCYLRHDPKYHTDRIKV